MSVSPAKPSNFTTSDRPTWDLYSRCIHCGLCLESCPTYRVLGLEADSPRGRIYQVLQADAGRLPIGDTLVTHIDRCLGCRACETACPSGVNYGSILRRTRAEIDAAYERPWLDRKLRAWFYGKVLRDPKPLQRWARVLRLYQRSGVQSFLRSSRLLFLLGLDRLDALAPRIESDFFYREIGEVFPARGPKRGRIALIAGCIASVAFAELNRATIRVLNANGVTVIVPDGQGCCGALHDHAGKLDDSRAMARRNIDALRKVQCDAIVNNAAGCGAMLKEYGELLADDREYSEAARAFAAKVRDISEYLAALGPLSPARNLKRRVTYQDPCHLAHAQGIRSAPRKLLQHAGVQLVEMPHADLCCGSAGTYNVTQHALSMKILSEKMNEIVATKADTVATANVGCMLQLRAGVHGRNLNIEVKHVIELLDEAYR